MIPWPQLLPRPQQDYSVDVSNKLITTAFEIGFRQRRRYSNTEDVIRVVWQLNQLQLDILRAFVIYELDNGANPFSTYIIGLDGIETAEVYLNGGVLKYGAIGPGYYAVSAELIRVAPTVMSEDMLGILGMEELASPDEFLFLCEALFIYIEEAYGDSASNDITNRFMELYG